MLERVGSAVSANQKNDTRIFIYRSPDILILFFDLIARKTEETCAPLLNVGVLFILFNVSVLFIALKEALSASINYMGLQVD